MTNTKWTQCCLGRIFLPQCFGWAYFNPTHLLLVYYSFQFCVFKGFLCVWLPMPFYVMLELFYNSPPHANTLICLFFPLREFQFLMSSQVLLLLLAQGPPHVPELEQCCVWQAGNGGPVGPICLALKLQFCLIENREPLRADKQGDIAEFYCRIVYLAALGNGLKGLLTDQRGTARYVAAEADEKSQEPRVVSHICIGQNSYFRELLIICERQVVGFP